MMPLTHASYDRIVRTFSLIFLSLAFTPSAQAKQVQPGISPPIVNASNKSIGWGSHGMAVFGGREGLYASHLPMFHAPHDTQVIIRFHLQDDAIEVQLRDALAQKPELWTFDPEEFDLLRLTPGHTNPLKKFTARFVQGHFERGGKQRFIGQTVIIDEVILFRRLSTAGRKYTEGRYHLIGKGSERFLVKEIDRRPDFDLIIALKPINKQTLGLPKVFKIPNDTLEAPTASDWSNALKKQAGSNVAIDIAQTLYFETEDLK